MKENIKELIISLLMKTINPDRVNLQSWRNCEFWGVFSANNTNDTGDWYEVNSKMLEAAIKKAGLSWVYLFETSKGERPVVSMFIGTGITAQSIQDEITKVSLQIGGDAHFVEGSYKDSCDNYRDFSDMERLVCQNTTYIIRMLEP